MLLVGVDMVSINRFSRLLKRYGNRFERRIFTESELACHHGNVRSLSVRYAAKEAVSKLLSVPISRIGWKSIEVVGGGTKQPIVNLYTIAKIEALKKKINPNEIALSLSHEKEFAIAFVVAESKTS